MPSAGQQLKVKLTPPKKIYFLILLVYNFSSDELIVRNFEWVYLSKSYSFEVLIPEVKYDAIKHKKAKSRN